MMSFCKMTCALICIDSHDSHWFAWFAWFADSVNLWLTLCPLAGSGCTPIFPYSVLRVITVYSPRLSPKGQHEHGAGTRMTTTDLTHNAQSTRLTTAAGSCCIGSQWYGWIAEVLSWQCVLLLSCSIYINCGNNYNNITIIMKYSYW